jgi:two-component system chemotaxis sensor kinase CheA
MAVDVVSGRGVGLDVVQEVVTRFRGELSARSEPGRGTTIDICVPISLSSITALGVEAAGQTAWVPLEAVLRTLYVAESDIARSSEGDAIVYGDRAVPFIGLDARLSQGARPARRGAARPVLVLRAGGGLAAVGVDRLRGVSAIVVRPLPRNVGACALVAGAAFDSEGTPELVLDPRGLVETAIAAAGDAGAQAPAKKPPILVIDDSLTTRMLEQSILEAAGYEVDLAVSAEDGLRKAAERHYGLFLVDVEMPGMNGFEFVARTRNDPAFRDIPAILVTSLGSPEHRRRGMEAGAHAHIVKGEFDEARLRQLIRDVMG